MAQPECGSIQKRRSLRFLGIERPQQTGGQFAVGVFRQGGLLEYGPPVRVVHWPRGQRKGSPEPDHRVGVAGQLDESFPRNGVTSTRPISEGTHEQEPQPVGPVGTAGDGQGIAARVPGRSLGRDAFGQQVAHQVGKVSVQAHLHELGIVKPAAAGEPKGGPCPF